MTSPADPAATPLTPALKAAIRTHYDGRCQYCGGPGATHVEHIIPKAKGGPDTLGNATLGCESCNLRKGVLDLDPMFVAIAHARAQRAAPEILGASKQSSADRQRFVDALEIERAAGVADAFVVPSAWNLITLQEVIRVTPKRRSSEAYIEGRVRGLRVGLQGGAAVKPARVPSGPTTRALLHYLDNRLRIDGSSRVPLDEFGAWASASGHRFVPERIAEAAALLSGQVYAVSHGEVYQGQIIEGLFAREAGGSFVDIDPGLRRAYRVA